MVNKFCILFFLLTCIEGSLLAQTDIYVAPEGTKENPGTISSPTTFEKAIKNVSAGGTIYVRGGTYNYSARVVVLRGNNGVSGALKKIFAYNNEKPVLDFSAEPYSNTGDNDCGFRLNGNYWHIKGLEIKGAADNGMYITGSNNIIEGCIMNGNRDSGMQLGRFATETTKNEWPSNNLILNCDSHDNLDPDNGEDADGFACKLTTGPGNVFKGCHAWNNVDDGWDLFTKTDIGPIDPIIFEGCVANNNGITASGDFTINSDGNGFKLGGQKIPVNHILSNCVAFNNKKHGFTFNSNPGSITLTNNTSFNNKQSNFTFGEGSHVFTNNLSYMGSFNDKISGTDISDSNVWWKNGKSTNNKSLIVTDADFKSIRPTISRREDGSLDFGNFLQLTAGSKMINAGVKIGEKMHNIGAF